MALPTARSRPRSSWPESRDCSARASSLVPSLLVGSDLTGDGPTFSFHSGLDHFTTHFYAISHVVARKECDRL